MANIKKAREYDSATLMIVNVKLRSSIRKVTYDVYAKLFKDLHERKIAIIS